MDLLVDGIPNLAHLAAEAPTRGRSLIDPTLARRAPQPAPRRSRLTLGGGDERGALHRLLPGAHFADEAFTENADLRTRLGRRSDVVVSMVTARLHGAIVRHRHGDGRIWASKGHDCAC